MKIPHCICTEGFIFKQSASDFPILGERTIVVVSNNIANVNSAGDKLVEGKGVEDKVTGCNATNTNSEDKDTTTIIAPEKVTQLEKELRELTQKYNSVLAENTEVQKHGQSIMKLVERQNTEIELLTMDRVKLQGVVHDLNAQVVLLRADNQCLKSDVHNIEAKMFAARDQCVLDDHSHNHLYAYSSSDANGNVYLPQQGLMPYGSVYGPNGSYNVQVATGNVAYAKTGYNYNSTPKAYTYAVTQDTVMSPPHTAYSSPVNMTAMYTSKVVPSSTSVKSAEGCIDNSNSTSDKEPVYRQEPDTVSQYSSKSSAYGESVNAEVSTSARTLSSLSNEELVNICEDLGFETDKIQENKVTGKLLQFMMDKRRISLPEYVGLTEFQVEIQLEEALYNAV